jgi:hypothetical protein
LNELLPLGQKTLLLLVKPQDSTKELVQILRIHILLLLNDLLISELFLPKIMERCLVKVLVEIFIHAKKLIVPMILSKP